MWGILGKHDPQGQCSHDFSLGTKIFKDFSTRKSKTRAKYSGANGYLELSCPDSRNQRNVFATNSPRNVSAVLDGEIFDAPTAQAAINRPFDAEDIVKLYLEIGKNFTEKIDGTYSIAVWDEKEETLLLIRDRLGTRPLFYSKAGDKLIFASDIKSVFATGLCQNEIDLCGLNYFLSYGYIPNPETLFATIRQVRPGHILMCKDGELTEEAYWKFTYRQDRQDISESYYKRKFLDIFEASVSKRIKRHPNAGAFLSGGLDTGSVVAMMRKLKGEPFKTFTAGFEERAYNEIGDAEILVDFLGLDHYTTIISFDQNFPELLNKIVRHHDAPFADTSAIPSYYVAKLAKEYVDTILTGDFPDQLIGGSGHHVLALMREEADPFWRRMLRNNTLNSIISSLRISAGSTGIFDKLKRFIYRETFPLEEQRIILGMPIPPLLKRCLYSEDLLAVNKKHNPLEYAREIYREVEDEDLLNKLLYFDVLSYAPDDLMVKVDRTCAAHGLNPISPFHDKELVEFIASVPSQLKIRNGVRKYIMREALRPLLPEHTLNKRKQGFAMPIGEWLTTKLSDYVRDVLLDRKTLDRGYFNKKFMEKMVNNFLGGKTDYASGSESTIISLITLELWHRLFVDGG